MTNPRPIGRTVTVAVPTGGLAAGRFGSGLLVVALSRVGCGVLATPAARGDEAGPVRPTWECLPEETTGLVRVPGGRAFVDALVERTRLGGLLFSPERNRRRREQWAEIAAQNPDEAAPWRSLLEYGRKISMFADVRRIPDHDLAKQEPARGNHGPPDP